jgi:hypothetical protein
MIAKELADQVRAEVKHFKEVQEQILRSYKQLCVHFGGPEWQKKKIDLVFHRVRAEVIPIMEEVGLDHQAVQALCTWAEHLVNQ